MYGMLMWEGRKKDYWSWYCSQFLPGRLPGAYCLFHAFHHELINPEAQVRVVRMLSSLLDASDKTGKNPSSDPMGNEPNKAKEMRIQWWKDQMSSSYVVGQQIREGKQPDAYQVPAHPVTQGFFGLMSQVSLSKVHISALFRAHGDSALPVTIADLEKYGNDTIGSILGLSTDCFAALYPKELSEQRRLDIDHAISHYAKAFSLFQLLRGTPSQLSRRVCYLPLQLLSQQKLSSESLYRSDTKPEGLSEVIYEVASTAFLHLEHVSHSLLISLSMESKRSRLWRQRSCTGLWYPK